jgi:hypothetical protein
MHFENPLCNLHDGFFVVSIFCCGVMDRKSPCDYFFFLYPRLLFFRYMLTLAPGIQNSNLLLTVDSTPGAPPSFVEGTTHYISWGPALLLDWTYDLSRFVCGIRSEYFCDVMDPNVPKDSRLSNLSFTGYFGVRF